MKIEKMFFKTVRQKLKNEFFKKFNNNHIK